jgi:hypothetical protein
MAPSAVRLTADPAAVYRPNFSPDGGAIAFHQRALIRRRGAHLRDGRQRVGAGPAARRAIRPAPITTRASRPTAPRIAFASVRLLPPGGTTPAASCWAGTVRCDGPRRLGRTHGRGRLRGRWANPDWGVSSVGEQPPPPPPPPADTDAARGRPFASGQRAPTCARTQSFSLCGSDKRDALGAAGVPPTGGPAARGRAIRPRQRHGSVGPPTGRHSFLRAVRAMRRGYGGPDPGPSVPL